MKISLQWLREWVDVPWAAPELGARLTMAGFELEALASGARVQRRRGRRDRRRGAASAGRQAAGLQGRDRRRRTLQIVCGAANARAGLQSALARVGAKLPSGLDIKAASCAALRSSGMLCSAKELGLATHPTVFSSCLVISPQVQTCARRSALMTTWSSWPSRRTAATRCRCWASRAKSRH
ncbi:MAG: hypothetical protein R3E65_12130 [Steroidobacteraceae bacterium]